MDKKIFLLAAAAFTAGCKLALPPQNGRWLSEDFNSDKSAPLPAIGEIALAGSRLFEEQGITVEPYYYAVPTNPPPPGLPYAATSPAAYKAESKLP